MKKKLAVLISILAMVAILAGCTVSGSVNPSVSPNTGGNSPAASGGAGGTSPSATGGAGGTSPAATGGAGGNVGNSPAMSPSPSPNAS